MVVSGGPRGSGATADPAARKLLPQKLTQPLMLVNRPDEADSLLLIGGTDADLRAAAMEWAGSNKPLFWLDGKDDIVVRFDSPSVALDVISAADKNIRGPWSARDLAHIRVPGVVIFRDGDADDDEDDDALTPIGAAARQAGVRVLDIPPSLLQSLREAYWEEIGRAEYDFIEWAAAEIRLAVKTRR